MKKIIIKKSKINNKGIFANEDIRKGETICLLRGEEKTIKQLKKDYLNEEFRINDPLQISKNKYLLLKKTLCLFKSLL
ncbi:hypothetical protein J4221_06945 [Candidatus Pacearchaeota archaeon]|nr:hypothetical protein [Candidatus Pacearchaeota archaeon]